MKIAIGSDHAGFEMKAEFIKQLKSWGHDVQDFGAHSAESVDYPDIAEPLCQAVVSGACDRGVVICGTGIGMSIAANKVKGIRCSLCSESYSARLTREHNDSNVLSIGARVTGIELALDILKTYLETEFPAAERNARRIQKIQSIEERQA